MIHLAEFMVLEEIYSNETIRRGHLSPIHQSASPPHHKIEQNETKLTELPATI